MDFDMEIDGIQLEGNHQTSTETIVGGSIENLSDTNVVDKGRKKTSIVWDHMKIVTTQYGLIHVVCNYCGTKYVRNNKSFQTSTYMRHLRVCIPKKVVEGVTQMGQRLVQSKLPFDVEYKNELDDRACNWKYDHGKFNKLAAEMCLAHEYAFLMFEHAVFNKFLKAINPQYKRLSRRMVKDEYRVVYATEKGRVKSLLVNGNDLHLTTDIWKSTNQKIVYITVTCHFIDNLWKLHKYVITFCHIPPPHTGILVANAIVKCMNDWGIKDKVVSCIVDNATYNDVCINTLIHKFSSKRTLLLEGKLFHVRCCTHILNLLVQDGLKSINGAMEKIRDGIKYILNSEARTMQFNKGTQFEGLKEKKLILDVPTRWNSRFTMLSNASKFQKVFDRYAECDQNFEVCDYLCAFEDATRLISGSLYPTINLFLIELYRIKELLNNKLDNPQHFMYEMATRMDLKFDKYWSNYNLLLCIGAILDPRNKSNHMQWCFENLHPRSYQSKVDIILSSLRLLYGEYEKIYNEERVKIHNQNLKPSQISKEGTCRKKFNSFVRDNNIHRSELTDLDIYLGETLFAENEDENGVTLEKFDVLEWWKVNEPKYKILSKMAKHILSIPITTVASESTFSAGGRIIDDRRASMKPETFEMLLCAADGVRTCHGLKGKADQTINAPKKKMYQLIHEFKDLNI